MPNPAPVTHLMILSFVRTTYQNPKAYFHKMEAVGVAVSFLELITPLLEAALLLRRYVKGREGLLDRKKWKESVRLGPDGTIYLGGWQIALEGEFRWQCLRGDENPQDDAGETMDNDPPQGDHGIRLEPIEEGSHGYGDAFPLATGPCSFLRNGSKPSRTHGIISPYTRLCSPSRSGDTSRYLKKAKKDAVSPCRTSWVDVKTGSGDRMQHIFSKRS